VVVALLAIPTALAIEHWSRMDKSWTLPLRVASVAAAAVLVTALLYHIVLEALFGATIGKGLLGLSVRNGSGEKWLASAIRNVARLLDSIVLYSVAFLFAAFSSKRQRIGDQLAGTVVVEQPVAWGARVALIVIWLAVVGGSLWIANFLCPSCLPAALRLVR
ncbi:MAG TPA: RDD family protein, partial [Thermoanaerobaculia bacterium]|nr:RDD family protein [Thermoanaerobaculia bacterium]